MPTRLGAQGEILAAEFLVSAGYHILVRNVRSRFSEGDIVCQEGNTIILVEVKARSTRFADPLLALTPAKLRRLRRVMHLLAAQYPNTDIRLDLVALYCEPDKPPLIKHYKQLI